MSIAARPALEAPPLTLGRVVVLVRVYDAALAFYRAAFGARVLFDAPSPSGDRHLHLGFGVEAPAPAEAAVATLARPVATSDDASVAHVADLYGNEFVLVELTPGAP